MSISKQQITAALAQLAGTFPQTFVLEKYSPHRPLKVGIDADIITRYPAIERRTLAVALSVYAGRIMYQRAMVAGAMRVDLDGQPAGEVTVHDAEHAAARLAGILASRQAKRVAVGAAAKVTKPAATAVTPAAPPAVTVLKKKPVLRLPAFRQKCG